MAALLLAGPASDIYSLGAVLLYAATGNLVSHVAGHPEQLPGELRPVIERCLAADPARRPTAAQLLTELTAARPAAAAHRTAAHRTAAARTAAVSQVGGWPTGTKTAGPAPSGSWRPADPRHQLGAAAFGSPQPPSATRPSRWRAEEASRAAGLRARAAGLSSRPRLSSRAAGLIKRPAVRIAVAALAFAVAVAATVYVIHPWPSPVQRPAGLTADQRGTTSISLGWSSPASGPLPDKYVILRDGAVTATVPGNQDHFNDAGLAPATTYNFQIIAYRGTTRSQPSPRPARRNPDAAGVGRRVQLSVQGHRRAQDRQLVGNLEHSRGYLARPLDVQQQLRAWPVR